MSLRDDVVRERQAQARPRTRTVENMPLDRYLGSALLLDLREVAQGLTPISVTDNRR